MSASTCPDGERPPSVPEADMFDEEQLRSLRHGTQDQKSLSSFQLKTVTSSTGDFDIKVWSSSDSGFESICLYISNIDKDPHLLWMLSRDATQVSIEICGETHRLPRAHLERSSSDFGRALKVSGNARLRIIRDLQTRIDEWAAYYFWCRGDVIQVWLAYTTTACYNTYRIRYEHSDDHHQFLFHVACLDFGRALNDSEFEALATEEIEHTISFRPLSALPTTLDDIQLAFTKAPLLDRYLEAGLEGFEEISQGPAYRQFDLSRLIAHVKNWNALLHRSSHGFVAATVNKSVLDNGTQAEAMDLASDSAQLLVSRKRSASVDKERPNKRRRKSSLKLEDAINTSGEAHKEVHWGQVFEREELRIVVTDKEVSFNDEGGEDGSDLTDQEVEAVAFNDGGTGKDYSALLDWHENSWDDTIDAKSSAIGD